MRATQKYKSLPYNPALRVRAKELRKAGILHEALFWKQIKTGKLNGLDFDRQKIIGNYIVDFYCAEKNAVIEIDGSSHYGKEDYDKQRDDFLISLGLTVIHIGVADVLNNMEGVLTFLKNHPALTGTPPQEGNENHPALTGTPPQEGNKNHPIEEGNEIATPPEEGNEIVTLPEEGNENHPIEEGNEIATPPEEGNEIATPSEEGNENHPAEEGNENHPARKENGI